MAIIERPVIVMALYDIGRDNWDHFNLSYNTYLWWMKNTLSLDANFVIFTEDKFKGTIEEYRREFDPNFERTVMVNYPLEKIDSYVRHNERLTNLMSSEEFKGKVHHPHVPEMSQPLYNIIMFNKLDFIKRAKDVGFFNSDFIIWADAGGLREDISNYVGKKWPDLDKINGLDNNKITFFSHSQDFNIDNSEFHAMSQIRYIQGTAFCVPSHMVDFLHEEFHKTVDECIDNGYIGSDEKIFDLTYVKDKSKYHLIKCTWREYFNILE
jgi:hypothetical protein